MTDPSQSLPPVPGAALVLDAPSIERALKRIAHEIVEAHPDPGKIALIGIPSRGVQVARRLAAHVRRVTGQPVDEGVIDVSMHRDDLHTRRRLWAVEPTHLPGALEGKTLVLADDVLFSGRTCRAAMDAISSFGRPARIQLAVLIDRGHRELPIRADYVGKNIPTAYEQRVFVRFEQVDGVPDAVWLEKL
jgi:pyrimidine operon attenuation protein/uracil phosphoribosyltransferase